MVTAAIVAASAPASAFACAVCFDASAETRGAFLGTTVFLSLLPLAVIGLIVFWLYRAQAAAAAEDV